MKHPTFKQLVSRLLIAGAVVVTGCESQQPLLPPAEIDLRRTASVTSSEQTEAVGDSVSLKMPEIRSKFYEQLGDERIQLLDELSDTFRQTDKPYDLGNGLDGKPARSVQLNLYDAIQLAVENNMDVKLAKLVPAISESQIVATEAAFDPVFFSGSGNVLTSGQGISSGFNKTNRPQPTSTASGSPQTPVALRENWEVAIGIRKPLVTGGTLEVATELDRGKNENPALANIITPDPAFSTAVAVGLSQPLLRNFGSSVTRSQVYLARNAHHRDVLNLYAQLLTVVGQVEAAYWQLFFAQQQLLVQQHLLDLTLETRQEVIGRLGVNATPVQVAQAHSFVEQRYGDLISARQGVRDASDQLKRLVNHPDLPLGDETVLRPSNEPVETPVAVNLVDAITTALQSRPEIQQALLDIDDSSIRQLVADNQRLPLLNVNASMFFRGLSDTVNESYDELITDENFVDFILNFQFEVPLGNRAAEAAYAQTRIARQAGVVRYKTAVQDVVLSVKQAVRGLRSSYELIKVNRAARRATAENLRAIEERKDTGEALTADFLLDLRLNTQTRLANAQLSELQSVIDYNLAVIRIHQATGVLLEHNNIEFQWPKAMFEDMLNDQELE